MPERIELRHGTKESCESSANPNERFETIFPYVGNSESKLVTLLVLDQTPRSQRDIYLRFVEATGGIWKPHKVVPFHYCIKSFAPVGLVEPVDTFNEELGFRLTDRGLYYQPVAAFLLSQSAELSLSLLEIFGSTSTRGKTRSVLNRAKILEDLFLNESVQRTIDIANRLGLDENRVGNHLQHLSEIDLVHYKSSQGEKGYVKYALSKGAQKQNVITVANHPRLTHQVADLFFELTRVDAHQLAKILKDEYPSMDINLLRDTISTILSGLVKQEVGRREDFEGGKTHSQAKITEGGKRVVQNLILPTKNALSDDRRILLESWRKIPWRTYAQRVIKKYQEASGHAHQHRTKQRVEEVLGLIFESPGIQPKEIQSILGCQPNAFLRILLEQDRVRRIKEGPVVRYYPNYLATATA